MTLHPLAAPHRATNLGSLDRADEALNTAYDWLESRL
jgi:hypothetical protein